MAALARLHTLGPAAIIAALVVVLGAGPASAQTTAPQESEMVALVNAHRAAHGLPDLRTDATLRTIARRHAAAMADAGRIYHNPGLRADMSGSLSGWTLGGENVGVGPSTAIVQEAFLASPTHRRNIESDRFDVIGIGAVRGADGRLYFVQVFADMATVAAEVAATPAPEATPVPVATLAPIASPTPAPVASPAILDAGEALEADAAGLGNRVAAIGFVDALLSSLTAVVARLLRRS